MNFDHLDPFGGAIVARFDTLTKNVKARSNSFYDSYLDLQEAFTKEALQRAGYSLDESKNSGYLLHGAAVKAFLNNQYGVPTDLVEKLHDHTLKANKHKHQKEKTITVDSVNAFMEPFYVFSRLCAGMTAVGQYAYDPQYFALLFDALEKENKELLIRADALMKQAEEMAAARKITEEELEACRGLVASLQGEKEDLEDENDKIKHAITFLQSITTKRIEKLEQQVGELDKKVATILNASAAKGTASSSSESPIPRRNSSREDEAIVKEFFKNAKLYFSDVPNGPVYVGMGRMMRRGIAVGIAGLVTFIIALCLPDQLKAFAVLGVVMLLYGLLMFLIGFKTAGYEMQDPSEFWIMAKGEAVFNGQTVVSAFFPARWKWITTSMFLLSLIGAICMLFASSPLVLHNPPSLAASFAVLQSLVSMVILILCIMVTGKRYEFRYVVFQYKNDVIRFDRITRQWTARDKRLRGDRL